MTRNYSKVFLIIFVILSATILFGMFTTQQDLNTDNRKTAQRFLLTDICLSTESRHTRNITLIEPIAAFQDAPGFYDHFPSSTFLRPDSIFIPNQSKPTSEY